MSHNREIEAKYNADSISLESFLAVVNGMKIKKKLVVSSYDDYFTKRDNFIRYRHSTDRGELTIKRKTSENNNFDRVEVNLGAEPDALAKVADFVELLGYKHDFTIYKTCHIYWFEKVDLVYYVVYDKELKELRRFIEIEALEDYPWESDESAWEEVLKYEKILESIGLSPQKRLKKSLFEIFRKNPA